MTVWCSAIVIDQANQFEAIVVRLLFQSFPADRTLETVLTTHVLEDGTELTIRLSTLPDKSELLYGADRKLLRWLLQRALERGERDVSWETLVEFLGPNPTISQKHAVFHSALRISGTWASCTTEDEFRALPLVRSRTYSEEFQQRVGTKVFAGEISFEFDPYFLEFVRKAYAYAQGQRFLL